MTRKRDRFFAGFGALLFLVTASALTIAILVSAISNHNSNKSNDTSNQTTSSSNKCPETSVASSVDTIPAVYKPTGQVKSLEVTDLTTGTGATVKKGDCLQVKYYGTLASDGTVFDENFDKDQAFQFVIGQGQVIQGWDQGMIGAKVGGVRRLVIPSQLGYGSQGNGSIPANSDLVFTVKVLAVK